MYSANVQSWIEILLSGTPRPAQSLFAAAAVLVAPMLTQAATATTSRPRTTFEDFMLLPLPQVLPEAHS